VQIRYRPEEAFKKDLIFFVSRETQLRKATDQDKNKTFLSSVLTNSFLSGLLFHVKHSNAKSSDLDKGCKYIPRLPLFEQALFFQAFCFT